MKETVVVGMSGGVDSSVAAYLLQQQGYRVIGVTMQIWQDRDPYEDSADGGCCGLSAVEDARRVAHGLGIPHYVMNFRREFREKVMDYFADEYYLGRTPNPCIACNRYVKWESLLTRSRALGADYIATGHYARIAKLASGRYAIQSSVTAAKDQTYALYNLTQQQLAHTLMPVGAYYKEEIRQMAGELGLPVATKKDSQEICFIPDHDYVAFLRIYTGRDSLPGNFVDTEGKVLGSHRGLIHYTVGQRKGLGIAFGEPMFVVALRPETNEVVLGRGEEVWRSSLTCEDVNYMGMEALAEDRRALVKIRYSHAGEWATLHKRADGRIECLFERPVRAVTPGQAAVFYDGDLVLGGGRIMAEGL